MVRLWCRLLYRRQLTHASILTNVSRGAPSTISAARRRSARSSGLPRFAGGNGDPPERGPPVVERRRADPVGPAELRVGRPGLCRLEDRDDLAVSEPSCCHGNLFASVYERFPLVAIPICRGDFPTPCQRYSCPSYSRHARCDAQALSLRQRRKRYPAHKAQGCTPWYSISWELAWRLSPSWRC